MRRRYSRRSGPRRRLVWARIGGGYQFTTGAPFNAAAVDLLTSFQARYGADPVGCTLMRIRGLITATHGSAAGVELVAAARVGNDYEASLTTTEQNPLTNGLTNDWFMYEPFVAGTGAGSGSLYWAGSDVAARLIDVKARRKLEELDQTLIMNIGSSTATVGTASGIFVLSMLLALP